MAADPPPGLAAEPIRHAIRPADAIPALARDLRILAALMAIGLVLGGCSAQAGADHHASADQQASADQLPGRDHPPGGHQKAGGDHPAAGQRASSQAISPNSLLDWMLTRSALARVRTDSSVRRSLSSSRIYELLRPGQQPLGGPAVMPVAVFTAVADLMKAVTHNQLPVGTRAVLYDPEAWSLTPQAEQANPARAAKQAAAVAHAHGLQFIVAPALNLVTVQARSSGPRWRRFLDLRLAAAVAPYADIVELQAQSLERNTGIYRSFVIAAAQQAREANPRVSVLAGLSTNPPGTTVVSQQLTAAIQATRGIVSGYWLNIPGRGPKCPTCNPYQPQVGIDALRDVLPSG